MSTSISLKIRLLFIIILFSTFNIPTGYSSVEHNPPAVENKKKLRKKNKKRFNKQFKNPNKIEDVKTSLYITFVLMLLLPFFVIAGVLLVYFAYPLLASLIIGISLISLGNGIAIAGGAVAGATKTYGTQVLSLALWVFFGINLAGSIFLGILAFTIFASISFFWILALALFILAIFMLIWVLIIRKQNKGLRNNSKEELK